ncbi:sugar transporter ERD6-like 5 [Hibiscus syriacus]|uniref:sugar transporter ERD6-like 5 n=1 Tax=Hibiscus syriacus TaxID=106335 RepID=UPI001924530F|nr:sugar transporter ERD6-like 5 [Hibiscus syriacus]
MEKNEMLEGLVTGKPVIIDEAETSARYGDSTVGYNHNGSSSVTGTVIFSSLAAISGAYAFGKVGYSSPAKSGITEDLGLSLAEMYYIYKQAMGISEVFCITGWLAIVFSKDVRWIDLGRLLIGCGSGILCYVNSVHVEKLQLFLFSGVVPCVLQLIGVFFIPDSPRWLAKTNETKEIEATLRRLRGEKADISQEATDIRLYTEYMRQILDGGLRNLFQKRYINPLIVGVGLVVFQQFGGLVVFHTIQALFSSFPNKVGSIPIAVLQWLFSEYSSSISPEDDHFCWFFCSFFIWAGGGGIPWIVVSEIFPINIKGSGGSLVNLLNWASSWVVSYTSTFLFECNSAGTFFIFAFISVVAIILIGKLVPETKGRTLEELQQHQ